MGLTNNNLPNQKKKKMVFFYYFFIIQVYFNTLSIKKKNVKYTYNTIVRTRFGSLAQQTNGLRPNKPNRINL